MNKVSKREQFLLFMLGMILLFVLFYVLAWTPMQSQRAASLAKRSELESRKTLMDTTLPLHSKLLVDLETGITNINLELDQIEDVVDEAEFERWIFPLLRNKDATIVSSNLGQAEVASPSASFYVKNDPMYNIKTMIQQINNISTEQAVQPTTESQLLKATHTYTFQAKYADFADILDEITAWNTTFFVNKASYNFDSEEGTISIDVYTVDKIETIDKTKYEGHYPATGLNDASDLSEPSGTPTGTGTTPIVDNNNNNIPDDQEDPNNLSENKDGITFFPSNPDGTK